MADEGLLWLGLQRAVLQFLLQQHAVVQWCRGAVGLTRDLGLPAAATQLANLQKLLHTKTAAEVVHEESLPIGSDQTGFLQDNE